MLGFIDAYVQLQTLEQYQSENLVVDPVCQMRFNKAVAGSELIYEGRTYYFCVDECRRKFVADPQRYLTASVPTSPTHPIAESQQKELQVESYELKSLGRQTGRLHHNSPPAEDLFEVLIVPSGGEAFVLDSNLQRVIVLEQAEGRAAEAAEVRVGMPFS